MAMEASLVQQQDVLGLTGVQVAGKVLKRTVRMTLMEGVTSIPIKLDSLDHNQQGIRKEFRKRRYSGKRL